MAENKFNRMRISNIREFILYGTSETGNKSDLPYLLRKETETSKITDRLEKTYAGNMDELDKAMYDLSDCIVTNQDIYFEMGFAFGISLAGQIQGITYDDGIKKMVRDLIDK